MKGFELFCRWNPSNRLSPDEALQHPWINEVTLSLK